MAIGTPSMTKKKNLAESETPAAKTTVKIPVDLHRKARTVASDLNLEIAEYIESLIRPAIEEAYQALGRKIAKEGD